MRQEEVSILIILVGGDGKIGGLCTAFGIYGLCLRILLRNKRRSREFTKLQLGFDTEKRCAASYERRTGGHAHITRLYVLYYFVFFAFVGELQVLIVEVEGGAGVVAHVELHLVAYRGVDVGLYLLIEVEIGLAACSER